MYNKKRSTKRSPHKKGKDSGYLLPILCMALITVLSAILIILFITMILRSDRTPSATSANTSNAEEITVSRKEVETSLTPITSSDKPADSTASLPITTPNAVVTTQSISPATTQVTSVTTVFPQTTAQPVTTAPIVTAPVSTVQVTTTASPVTTQPPKTEENPMNFKADLSSFEKYMDPSDNRWDDAYLMLVNVNHKLEPDQEKSYPVLGGVVRFSKIDEYDYTYYPSLKMNENAIMALTAMFLEAEANGLKGLDVTSAYRDYSKQSEIFNSNCEKTYHWLCENENCSTDWIGKESKCPICGKRSSDKDSIAITQEEKEENVATYSCAPGTSDHQTGLAVDIVDTSLPSRFNDLIQEYGQTESGKWLAENCWKFGFVLRFPPDKEAQTGIIYEPWHFRFVGRTHAAKMTEMNMCLEEYTEYLESTGYFD